MVATQLAGLTILLPQRVDAISTDNFLTVNASKNLELVYDFIERCNHGQHPTNIHSTTSADHYVRFANNINRERMEAGQVFNFNTGATGTDYGGEKKQPLSSIFGDNASKKCQDMTKTVATILYGDYNTFRDTFWKYGGEHWDLKSPYDKGGNEGANEMVNTLRQAATAKGYPVDNNSSVTLGYRWMTLRKPLESCFVKTTGASGSVPDSMSIFKGPDGKKYAYKAGVEKHKVSVGPIIDSSTGPFPSSSVAHDVDGSATYYYTDDDGTWSCAEFAAQIKNNTNWFRSVFVKDYPQQVQQQEADAETAASKHNNIYKALSDDNTKLVACLRTNGSGSSDLNSILTKITNVAPITPGIPDLGEIEQAGGADTYAAAATVYQSVTDWLIAHPKDASPPKLMFGSTTAVEAAKAKKFRDCVLTNYTSINTELEREPPTIAATEVDGGDTSEADNSCEAKGDLAWILCPVVKAMSGVINWLTTQVSSLLSADRNKYTDDSLYKAWSNIRNIALALLIALMMVMVIATALGTQMFDAYTVKRALPRMVAAIMFIVFSWYICVAIIDIFNAAGSGVMGIMTSPFKAAGKDITLASVFGSGAGDFLANWLAAPAATIAVILIAVFFGSTILLTIGVAFLVLVLRQLFIITLMLLAPLAILAWIFPGNDKLWKMWWGSFSKLLMMYPLIMALLAAGRIFAVLTSSGSSAGLQGLALDPVIKLVAFTIPFGFIPFTFKVAGGMFATVAGMANDRSKGLFDRAKRRRGEKAERWKSGNAFKGAPEGSVRSKFNKGVNVAANAKHFGGMSALRNPRSIAGNIRGAMGEQEFEHAMESAEKLPGAKAFFASDDLMLAGLNGQGDMQKTRQYLMDHGYRGTSLDNMAGQVMRMQKQMGMSAFNVAALAKAPATGTAFVGDDIGEWHQLIAKHTHGDGSLAASIVAQGKSGFRSAQRYEASEAGFGDHMRAITMAGDGRSAQAISEFIADRAYASGGPAAVVGARNEESARMFAGAMVRDMRAGYEESARTGDESYAARSLAAAAAVHNSSGSAKRLVNDVLATEVFGADALGTGHSTLEEIDSASGTEAYLAAQREFEGSARSSSVRADNAAARAAAAAAAQQGGAPGGGMQPPLPPPGTPLGGP